MLHGGCLCVANLSPLAWFRDRSWDTGHHGARIRCGVRCGRLLLEQTQVRSWTAMSFPIVLVDEGQDLRPQRLRMLVALSGATHALIAADEFQCLDQALRPNPLVAWLQNAAVPETLVQVRRTNVAGPSRGGNGDPEQPSAGERARVSYPAARRERAACGHIARQRNRLASGRRCRGYHSSATRRVCAVGNSQSGARTLWSAAKWAVLHPLGRNRPR